MYFILQNEPENHNLDFYADGTLFQEDGTLAINIFDSGRKIKDRVGENLTMKLDSKYTRRGKLTDRIVTRAQKSFHLLVVSGKMKQLLDAIGTTNIEYLKLKMIGQNETIDSYFIANVLSLVDCVDDANSTVYYKNSNDNILYSIYGIRMAYERIPTGLNLFLMDRYEGGIVVFHERVKQMIEKEGIKGFNFIEPEKFAI